MNLCKTKYGRSVLGKFRISDYSLAIERGDIVILKENKVFAYLATGENMKMNTIFSDCPCNSFFRGAYVNNKHIHVFKLYEIKYSNSTDAYVQTIEQQFPVIIKITAKYINDCLSLRTRVLNFRFLPHDSKLMCTCIYIHVH